MLQQLTGYTEADHETWSLLMKRIQYYLDRSNVAFREGLKKISLDPNRIPEFEALNEKLLSLTGWRYQAAAHGVSNLTFMEALSKKTFLASTFIRGRDELNFCKLPDVFHDVMGHAGMLAHPGFCAFLEKLGHIGVRYAAHEGALRFLFSIYWYTAEVGLIMEDGEIHYYGGSVISSISEINRISEPGVLKLPYHVLETGNTPYNSFKVNNKYFIINALSDLNDSLEEIEQAAKLIHGEMYVKTT